MRLLKRRTRHTAPIHLRILHARHTIAKVPSAHRPPRLRDPDPRPGFDVVDLVPHLSHAVPENVVGVRLGRALVIGVPVRADEVARLDDGRVGAVDPCGPGVYVAHLHAPGAQRPEHTTHVVDLAREGTSARVAAVEVLAADADSDDPIMAVGLDGRL